MQGSLFCTIVILAAVSLILPDTVIPVTHWHGRIFSMAGAAETRSHRRKMRHMNPLGDSMSYHGWSVWRLMNSLGFPKKYFWMNADRRFHKCTDIICSCGKYTYNIANIAYNIEIVFVQGIAWCRTNDKPLFKPIVTPQIASFMGPIWGPPGSRRPQVSPMLPNEPCHQGLFCISVARHGWPKFRTILPYKRI